MISQLLTSAGKYIVEINVLFEYYSMNYNWAGIWNDFFYFAHNQSDYFLGDYFAFVPITKHTKLSQIELIPLDVLSKFGWKNRLALTIAMMIIYEYMIYNAFMSR